MKIALIFSLLLCSVLGGAQPRRLVFQQPEMGSLFTVQVYATDSAAAATAAAGAFRLADSLNLIFSDYRPDSELNRLCRKAESGRWTAVSPALWAILREAKRAWRQSDGAFDVTLGRPTGLWRASRRSHQLPWPDTLAYARHHSGMQHLQLRGHRVRFRHDRRLRLDLGGIGKGYAAREMLTFMQKAGFAQALADAAGNMAAGGHPGPGWSVGIQQPGQDDRLFDGFIFLKNQAISTSGDVYQSVSIGGIRYSHLLNPRTGLGLTRRRQVTVLCADAAIADWLSTACSLLPPRQALRLARRQKARLLWLEQGSNGLEVVQTPGFSSLRLSH